MSRAIRAALELFRDFREKEPERIKVVNVDWPRAVMVIGYVDEIFYTTTHGRKVVSYRHPFRKGSRPLLASSADGKQLVLLEGKFKFTDRGIVDRDDEGNLIFHPDHGEDEAAPALGPAFLRRRQAE